MENKSNCVLKEMIATYNNAVIKSAITDSRGGDTTVYAYRYSLYHWIMNKAQETGITVIPIAAPLYTYDEPYSDVNFKIELLTIPD